MRRMTTVLGMSLLLAACGDKKAPEAPKPAPTGVERGTTPPPVVAEKAGANSGAADKAAEAEAKAAEKAAKAEAKAAEAEAKAAEAKAAEAKAAEKAAEAEAAEKAAEAEAKAAVVQEPGGAGGEPGNQDGPVAIAPELVVNDSALTSAIVNRMPDDRRSTWKVGDDARLIAWFEFQNPGPAVELEMVWKKGGKENWRFPTSAGTGKNWRTWAEKRIGKRDAGEWTVEVVDANGYVYQTLAYTVE